MIGDTTSNLSISCPFFDSTEAPYVKQMYKGERVHNGLDLHGSKQEDDPSTELSRSVNVLTPYGGVVKDIKGRNSVYGNAVVVEFSEGPYAGKRLIFEHLAYIQEGIAIGTSVSCGDPLGMQGNTGGSSGIHLHISFFSNDGKQTIPEAKICGFPEEAPSGNDAYGIIYRNVYVPPAGGKYDGSNEPAKPTEPTEPTKPTTPQEDPELTKAKKFLAEMLKILEEAKSAYAVAQDNYNKQKKATDDAITAQAVAEERVRGTQSALNDVIDWANEAHDFITSNITNCFNEIFTQTQTYATELFGV